MDIKKKTPWLFLMGSSIIGTTFFLTKKKYENVKDNLSFAEKNVIYWQRKVYDQKTKFFIKIKAHNWDELIKNRDHFFVYFGQRSNAKCLSFAPRLSYIARKAGVNIYYIDTAKSATNPILKKLREELGIIEVPALLHVDYSKITHYNFNKKLEKFINDHR